MSAAAKLPASTDALVGVLLSSAALLSLSSRGGMGGWTLSFLLSAAVLVNYPVVFSPAEAALSKSYANCRVLDGASDFRLHWNVLAGSQTVEFAMEAQSTGWVALGVSGDGTMGSGGAAPGSDIVVGSATLGSNDYFTTVYDIPKLDASNGGTNDCTAVASEQDGATLRVEFSRPLAASDSATDRAISATGVNTFLWALHDSIAPTSTSVFPKHTRRGPVTIDLSVASTCPPAAGNDVSSTVDIATPLSQFSATDFEKDMAAQLGVSPDRIIVEDIEAITDPICPTCTTLDFNITAYAVPSAATTYVCAAFALSTTQMNRVVAFQALPDNKNVIHHMVLYQIQAGAPAPNTATPADCATQMPVGAQPLFAWAPGGDAVILPPEAEVRVGGSTGVHYIVIQYHYDNPGQLPSEIDNSGVRFYIDNVNTRANQAGFLFVGMNPGGISIPAGRANHHQGGECSTATIPYTLNVFSWAPHMHYLGKQGWFTIERGSTTVFEAKDEYYDFAAQKFTAISATIEQGDIIKSHCVWDSSQESSTTFGGDETNNEMCLIALLYWPVIPGAGSCVSKMWGPCNCNYGFGNCSDPACTPAPTQCGQWNNCSACQASGACAWCDSSTVTACVPDDPTYNGGCSALGGTWTDGAGTCQAPTGTPCTTTHDDCASCNAASGCIWCQDSTRADPTVGFCLGDSQGPSTVGQTCTVFGGFVESTCPA